MDWKDNFRNAIENAKNDDTLLLISTKKDKGELLNTGIVKHGNQIKMLSGLAVTINKDLNPAEKLALMEMAFGSHINVKEERGMEIKNNENSN